MISTTLPAGINLLSKTMKRAWLTIVGNHRLMLITFEIFWIVVFLLDRVGRDASGGVPQFVYVNF